MKRTTICRFNALALVLALLISAFFVTCGSAEVKAATATSNAVTRIYVESYNDAVPVRDGQKLTQALINKLHIVVMGQKDDGSEVNLPTKVKEKNQYLHASNGKVKITVYYGNLTKSVKVKAVKAKAFSAKKAGKLYEGQILTHSMVTKAVKANVKYKNGKKVTTFKGYSCSQEGKVVKPNSKGKFKLTLKVWGFTKKLSVPVVKMKKIFIASSKLFSLKEGASFNKNDFVAKTVVKATYKNGVVKKLKSYSVSAPAKVSGTKFSVKISYGKYSDSITIPVVKSTEEKKPSEQPSETPSETPSEQPSETPSETPSEQPTETPTEQPTETPTEQPTETPTEQPTEQPTETPTEQPTEQPTETPTEQPTEQPTETPTEQPTETPTEQPTETPTEQPTEQPEVKKYEVCATATNGTVVIDGITSLADASKVVPEGTEVSLEAIPNSGYEFCYWISAGKVVSTQKQIKLTVSKDVSLEAVFQKKINKYQLMVVAINGNVKIFGIVENANAASQEIAEGTIVTLEGLPDEGFDQVQWTDETGKVLGTDTKLEVKMDSSKVVTAKFAKTIKNYTLTTKSGTGGHVTINNEAISSKTVKEGTKLSLNAVADEGYRFTGWTTSGGISLGNNSPLEVELTANVTINANFEKIVVPVEYTIKVNVSGEGTATAGGVAQKTVKEGTKVSLSATPATGWEFVNWTSGSMVLSSATTFDVTVNSNLEVVANFKKSIVNYTLSVSATNGKVNIDGEPASSKTVAEGTSVTLVAIANDDYEFVNWTNSEGKEIGKSAMIQLAVNTNSTIYANFGKKAYNVTINSNSSEVKLNGRSLSFANGEAVEAVTTGTTITLTANDSSSYRFVRWASAGRELSTSKSYMFTVTSDISINAVFERVYTLTVKRVGGKGKVVVNNESLDFYDNVATISLVPRNYDVTAIATDDYNFVSIADSEGKVLSKNTSYSIGLSGDKTIIVNFAEVEKTVMVTYINDTNTQADVEILKSEAVTCGETLAPSTNVQRDGYIFKGWKIGETIYAVKAGETEFYATDGTSLSDAIKALTKAKTDVTVSAVYEEEPKTYYSLSLTGAQVIESVDLANVEKGTHIHLTADSPAEGKKFSNWKVNGVDVYTDSSTYDFYISGNTVIVAVFVDEEVEVDAKPSVFFAETDPTKIINYDNHTLVYKLGLEVPEKYTIVEWGILYNTSRQVADVTKANGYAIPITESKDASSVYWTYTDTNQDLVAHHGLNITLSVRAYVTVTSVGGGEETFYSEVGNSLELPIN